MCRDSNASAYVLKIREPSFHEHRCLRLAQLARTCTRSAQTVRRRFGSACSANWLRTHPEDRTRYEVAKRAAIRWR
jgi:hypothetical protein